MNEVSWLDTAGRWLIVGFFLAAGAYNVQPAMARHHIERLGGLGLPLPAAVFWFGMALQFSGCAMLIADWHADAGALCLILFTVTANALFHRFWTVAEPVRRNTLRLMLLNGIAITGGLLLLLHNTLR
jgi:uncharacterized membrane protein YphA (DoxX/SURF4 family)